MLETLKRRLAVREFAGIVGKEWVFATPDSCRAYVDEYALRSGDGPPPVCAVAPKTAAQVQELIRVASRFRLAVWPISRGKNLGYGGAQPLLPNSVVIDLRRMTRILEVDERCAYCVVEPGVSFADLFNHLKANGIHLWMSIPGHSWGSVVGNALERGLGYTPYGDHASRLCGLEVVLPDGEIVRTGMGAMTQSRCWRNYPAGFGPALDGLFIQSNLGIVTQAGLELMPEPPATLHAKVSLPRFEDLAWAIDVLAQLRMRGLVEHPICVGNYLHDLAPFTQRSKWQADSAALDTPTTNRLMHHFGLGAWNFSLTLLGYPEVIEAQAHIIRRMLDSPSVGALEFQVRAPQDPPGSSPEPIPSRVGLQIVNWHGGRGAHVNFSPALPAVGELALEQARATQHRFEEHGLDYCASFIVGQRHINNINTILYDRNRPGMPEKAAELYRTLLADATARGYGQYRTHIDFMQEVADTFDYNNHAMRRLNERLKDAVDPRGILAPGKNGIWPRRYRR